MELDCDICMEPFDSSQRRPRLLPCGHTYCLACLLRMFGAPGAPGALGAAITCPEDRKAIPIHPNELVDNFYIMSRLDEISMNNKEPVRLWCRDCKSAAGEACEGSRHRLQRLQEVRAARAAQAARQVEALERLGAGLRRAEEHCASQRQALQDAAARLRLFISHSGGVGPEWDRTWEEAQRGAHLLQAAEQVQPCPEKLDFREITFDDQPTRDEKMTALVQPNVTALTGVECNVDPVWTLALLVKHAMHLEELQLRNVHREHLLVLQGMPRLRALDVQDWHVDLETRPVEFQEATTSPLHTLLLLRDGGGSQDEDSGLLPGLRTLEADLPPATLQSLVRAHRHSLQSLRLWAGDASEIGGDLPALLRASGATRLQRLCLQRGSGPHCERRCAHQLAALRQDMPACRVACTACKLMQA